MTEEMMRVKNPAYAGGKELIVGKRTFTSDEQGVFDVPESTAKMLLTMKGFHKPRITLEVAEAEQELRRARRKLRRAEEEHDVAVQNLRLAQADADAGRGTTPEEAEKASVSPETSEEDSEPDEDDSEEEEASEDDSEEEEASEDEEESEEEGEDEDDEDEEEASSEHAEVIKEEMQKAGKGVDPTMRWSLDALIRYCNAIGIDANSSWSKSDCVREIEEREG